MAAPSLCSACRGRGYRIQPGPSYDKKGHVVEGVIRHSHKARTTCMGYGWIGAKKVRAV